MQLTYNLQEKIKSFPTKRKDRILGKISEIWDWIHQIVWIQLQREYVENMEKINTLKTILTYISEDLIIDQDDLKIVNITDEEWNIWHYWVIKKDNITYQLNSLITCNNHQKIPLPPWITLIDKKIYNLWSALLYKIIEEIKNKWWNTLELEFNDDVKIFYEKILYIFSQQNIIKNYKYVKDFEKPNIFDLMFDGLSEKKLNKIQILLK